MKKNRIWLYILLTVMGASSIYIGGFVLVEENLKMISGLCIGIGAAVFSISIGNLIGALILSKTQYDEILRKKNILVNDERNIRIREKVRAKINQVVIYVLSVIIIVMGFMRINIIAIIMVASVFLIEFVLAIALTGYYSKRM